MLKTEMAKRSFVATVIAIPCLVVLIWRFIDFIDLAIHGTVITLIFELMSLAIIAAFAIKNEIALQEFGLRITDPRKVFGESLIISAVLIAIGIIGKVVIIKIKPDFFPVDAPFFRWRSRSLLGYFYVVTALIQEFLARGVLQKGLDELFDDKRKTPTVLLLCALIFSLFHIHSSFPFMLAAGGLAVLLGILYERHQNVFSVAAVHYLVGYAYIHLFIPA